MSNKPKRKGIQTTVRQQGAPGTIWTLENKKGKRKGGPFSSEMTTIAALDLTRGVIRNMVRAHYADDSCIASTGLVVDILRDMGIEVEAVSCHVIAMNERYMQWAAGRDRLVPLSAEEESEAAAAGGRLIVMAGAPQPGRSPRTLASVMWHEDAATPGEGERFPGHVVALATVDGRRFLIDLSIDQLERPNHDMLPTPIVLPVQADFEKEGDAIILRNNGMTMIYERTHDESFRESNNFTRIVEGDAAATVTMNELRMSATLFLSSLFRALQNGRAVRGVPPSNKIAAELRTPNEFAAIVRDIIAAVVQFNAMQDAARPQPETV